MSDFEQKTENLREKIRGYKERSQLTYKVIAQKVLVPYSSFRNFMYGCKISENRYNDINTSIDKMIAELPW